jgi:hypothetical protein
MTPRRWDEIHYGVDALTPEEIALGWHFCRDWDGLLVGPGTPELDSCHCGLPTAPPEPPQ